MRSLMAKDDRGQIAVFLCIICSAMLLCAIVFAECSKAFTSRAQAGLAVENSIQSALAGYDAGLKDNYGIFAFHYSSDIQDTVMHYLDLNLKIPKGIPGCINAHFNEFNVEDLACIPSNSLIEPGVIEHQINDFMKYRGLTDLAGDVVRIIDDTKNYGKVELVIEKKMLLEQVMNEMEGIEQSIRTYISGSIGNGPAVKYCINKFIGEDLLKPGIDLLNQLFDNCMFNKWKITELEKKRSDLNSIVDTLNSQSEKDDAGKKIAELSDEISVLSAQSEKNRQTILTALSDMKGKILKPFLEPNQMALKCLETLPSKLEDALKKADDIIGSLDGLLSGAETLEEAAGDAKDDFSVKSVMSTVESEVNRFRNLLPDKNMIENLSSILNQNISVINMAISFIDEFAQAIGANGVVETRLDEFKNRITEMLKQYCANLTYRFISSQEFYGNDSSSGVQQTGDEAKAVAREELQKYDLKNIKCVELEKLGIDYDKLPSKRKEPSSAEIIKTDMDTSEGNGFSAADTGRIAGKDPKAAFNAMDSGKGILSILEYSRDKIFLVEYITGMLKNTLSCRCGMSDSSNLSGVNWTSVDTLFSSEVEYIICGSQSEKVNRLLTEGMILSIRFGLNLIHVYADPEKRRLASTIAAAASGWWSGGAAVPFVSSLLMCSWAAAESIIDINDLLDGKGVPLYKNKSQWKLDLGLSSIDAGSKISGPVLKYIDYLRLILLIKSKDSIINRLMDIIEINMRLYGEGSPLDNFFTCLTVKTKISYKGLLQGFDHSWRTSMSMSY